ncbi:MAG: regulatory protein RecX [Sphaerochaeta sp.]
MFAIIKRKASGEGYFALPQGLSPFFISKSLFLSSHLHEGQELSEEEFLSLKEAQLVLDCRSQAMLYLARREHSVFELKQKLIKKGYTERQIQSALDPLLEQNLLSELRFAQALIASRQKKNPEGKSLLRQRLVSKGVNRSDAEKALSEAFTEENLILAIQKAYQIALRGNDSEVAQQKLQKRGFSRSEIRFALERLEDDTCS